MLQCERASLEAQLGDEFDFVKEADAMERIGKALRTDPDGLPCEPPLVTPLPVAGLVTRRVLVLEKGLALTPLSAMPAQSDPQGARLRCARLGNAVLDEPSI